MKRISNGIGLSNLFISSRLLCALLLCFSFIFAQDLPFLRGKVTDAKGIPIPGAVVRLLQAEQTPSAETLTDLDGNFRFDALPGGIYRLTVEIAGFKKAIREEVRLTNDAGQELQIQLESLPRPPRPPVLRARSKPPVQGSGSEVTAFQVADVTDLPGLNQFKPDTSSEETAMAATSRGEGFLFISGSSANLDAGSMNDPNFRRQITDMAQLMGFRIQEFTPGQEGRMGGMAGPGPFGGMDMGGASTAGVPGGGPGFASMPGRMGRGAGFRQPKVEGNLSETYSNSALNARSYSLTGKTLPKPVRIQNDFSVTLGGVLPFFKNTSANQPGFGFGRGQAGWSFTYGGNRNRNALDILTTVPTDLERSGDFSQTYVQALAIDPATGKQNVVTRQVQLYHNPADPSSRFTRISAMDPIAAKLLQFIPQANLPCQPNAPCVNNYALQRSLPSRSDQIQLALTGLRLTSRDNLGFNYSLRRSSSLNAANFPGLDSNRTNFSQSIGISGMHSFQQRLVSNWRINLNRTSMENTNAFAYARDVAAELGITGVSKDPINWGPPTINFTNYGNLSLAAPSINRNQNLTISGSLMKIGKDHSFQAGGDIQWAQRNSRSDSNGRGTYTFTGYATILLDARGQQVPGTGHDFADFLLGLPYSTSRRYVDPTVNPYGNSVYIRSRSWNLYIMDNWRARSNLTVNYGLRYEYVGPAFEKYNRLVSLDAARDFSTVAQVFPNSIGPISGRYYGRSLIDADRNNIAPRVGVAWRPTPRSRLVIRFGYGIGYNLGRISSLAGQLVNQPPFAVTQNLASDRSRPLTLRVGFPINPDLAILNTYAVDPNYSAAYAQQWNFDIQTQISRLYFLNLTYSGSKGNGLDILRVPENVGKAGKFVYQTNGGSSIYHGLNVQFSRRFSQGFNLMSTYTFSKSIDTSSGGGNSVAQNDADLAAERALSDQDQRHNFRINFAYELPIGKNRMFFSGASSRLLNFISGWTFNGSLNLASGFPVTARYASSGKDPSGAALYNSLRPDATGLPVKLPRSARTVSAFFNTAAFTIPAGTYGNAGRNTIPGPGNNVVNLSIRKSFNLDENNRRLDFTCQIQNLLNHPSWSSISTTVNALNFGQVTGVRAMRSMTMNIRIRF